MQMGEKGWKIRGNGTQEEEEEEEARVYHKFNVCLTTLSVLTAVRRIYLLKP